MSGISLVWRSCCRYFTIIGDFRRSSFDEGFVGGFVGKLWGDRSVY
jgi:hypothetical protein